MKNKKNILVFDKLIYKLIGTLLIGAFIIYLQTSYYEIPKYGDLPALILALIVLSIYILLPYIIDKIISIIFLLFYSLYYIGQLTYYKFFGQYIYITTAFDLFNEAKDYSGDFFIYFTFKEWLTIILLIIVIIFLCLIKRKKKPSKTKTLILILISLIGLFISSLLIIKNNKKLDDAGVDPFYQSYSESDRYVYENIPSSKEFVEKFGIEEYLFKDIKNNILKTNKISNKERKEIEDFLNNNIPYQKNEYTGIFEGKNLLVVEAESLNTAAINKDLTPTLYRLMNEGFYFKNYYSPALAGSTSDAEVMVNTSLIPINKGETVSHKYYDNYYPTTLAKGFKNAGYKTSSYHSGYYLYYSRNKFFPNLGYDELFGPTELLIDHTASDLEIVAPITYITIEDNNFFTFWITYSGHQPYSYDSIDEEGGENTRREYREYLDIVKEYYPDLDEKSQVYIAKNMSLDRALEFLLNNYEFSNKLDDLVLVIYGDHRIKGEFDDDLLLNVTGGTSNDTPLIIYNHEVKGKKIDKHCTNIDIMPTIFNLFNIEYDKNTVLGNDIFDERYHGFSFDSSWEIKTDDYNYSLSNGFSDLKIDIKDAKQEIDRYLKYQEIANNIFISNYFKEDD